MEKRLHVQSTAKNEPDMVTDEAVDFSNKLDMTFSNELGIGIHYVSSSKIVMKKDDRGFELLIRPDVAEEIIISLLESVLMAVGGSMSRPATDSDPCFTISTTQSSGTIIISRIYLGG